MAKSKFIAAILGLLTAFGASQALAYDISGRVSLGSLIGPGVAGVSINGGALGNRTTDANGQYSFTGLPNGTNWALTPSKAGYTFSPSAPSGTITSNNVILNFIANCASGYVQQGSECVQQNPPTPVPPTATATRTATPTSVPSPQNYSITGRVTLGSLVGPGVQSVTISGGALGNRSTDSGGNYSYTGVPNGTNWALTPSKTGYTFNPSSPSGTISSNNVTLNFIANCAPGYIQEGNNCVPSTPAPTATATRTPTPSSPPTGQYSITGRVTLGSLIGPGVANINILGGALGNRITDSNGSYSFTGLPNGTNWALTPSKTGYLFSPPAPSGTITSNNVVLNFIATCASGYVQQGSECVPSGPAPTATATRTPTPTTPPAGQYSITGRVTLGSLIGPGVANININGGSLGVRITDSNGNYSFTGLPNGTNWALTPSKTGYLFNPPAPSGTITSNNVILNFIATCASGYVQEGNECIPVSPTPTPTPTRTPTVAPGTFSISGTAFFQGQPLPGVTLNGGALGNRTTNSSGFYIFANLPNGTVYQITPSLTGYVFNPPAPSGTITSNNVVINFIATCAPGFVQQGNECVPVTPTPTATPTKTPTPAAFSISGTAFFQGLPLPGVTLNGGALGNRTTNSSGFYIFANLPNGTPYQIVPSLLGYVFQPSAPAGTITNNNVVINFIASCAPGFVQQNNQCVARVVPILECINTNSDGTVTAFYGYQNNDIQSLAIPVGTENRFVPNPENRGQPVNFAPGRFINQFLVSFPAGTGIEWILNGQTAPASSNSPECVDCSDLDISATQFDLDSNAMLQRNLVRKSANNLIKKNPGNSKAKTFAVKSKKSAQELFLAAWMNIYAMPSIQTQCPDGASQCITVSNTANTQAFTQSSDGLQDLLESVNKRRRKLSGQTKKQDKFGRKLEKQGAEYVSRNNLLISTLPTTRSECQ